MPVPFFMSAFFIKLSLNISALLQAHFYSLPLNIAFMWRALDSWSGSLLYNFCHVISFFHPSRLMRTDLLLSESSLGELSNRHGKQYRDYCFLHQVNQSPSRNSPFLVFVCNTIQWKALLPSFCICPE